MEITWTKSGATMPGGFFTDILGYFVFLTPAISHGIILWHWTVQSGGGYNWLGGRDVKIHSEGDCPTVGTAEEDILEALQNLGVEFE